MEIDVETEDEVTDIPTKEIEGVWNSSHDTRVEEFIFDLFISQ
jgi:hypothetical protein